MDTKRIINQNKLDAHVKEIFVLEEADETKESLLPFFADGCPGIMFQQTTSGAFRYPKKKELSTFFMYGQTLHPIEISIKGVYRLIVFQLYPFAAKALFNINPKELKDDCYDLNLLQGNDINETVKKISQAAATKKRIELIAAFIAKLVQQTTTHQEQKVQLAINLVTESKGLISVKELTQKLHITERTLQRQFAAYVGISPKQFAKIVQFQASIDQLGDEVCSRLTEIVYENGYADQSHFIRSFKKFTGKKPSQFRPSQ